MADILARGNKGLLYLRRRVPVRFAEVDRRKIVWVALHTDSFAEAQKKAVAVWAEHMAAWEARLAGESTEAGERFEAARQLAAARNLRYLPARQVAALPLPELVERIKRVRGSGGRPDPVEARALLGGVEPTTISVSGALATYWSLAADKTIGMSDDQKRIWRNPRKKAVKNFISVIGDKPLDQIDRDDMLDFRQWWMDRLAGGEVSANSANKEIGHLSSILQTVNEGKRLGLTLPIGKLSLKEGEQRARPPFSDEWIRDKLLKPDALAGLNSEARNILLTMVNTGARPSEIAALLPGHIHLDADVPHIAILPVGRHVKSRYSIRKIPLTGVSLEAMKQSRDGFSRYRNKQSFTNTINKFLRENHLLETPDHVLYSLRHSFEDRLLAAGIDERIRRDLMGHRLDRERYGQGASLARVAGLLQEIAL